MMGLWARLSGRNGEKSDLKRAIKQQHNALSDLESELDTAEKLAVEAFPGKFGQPAGAVQKRLKVYGQLAHQERLKLAQDLTQGRISPQEYKDSLEKLLLALEDEYAKLIDNSDIRRDVRESVVQKLEAGKINKGEALVHLRAAVRAENAGGGGRKSRRRRKTKKRKPKTRKRKRSRRKRRSR